MISHEPLFLAIVIELLDSCRLLCFLLKLLILVLVESFAVRVFQIVVIALQIPVFLNSMHQVVFGYKRNKNYKTALLNLPISLFKA